MKAKTLNVPPGMYLQHLTSLDTLHLGKSQNTNSQWEGGHTSIFLTGMLIREQISTARKRRMTQNSNPKKQNKSRCNVCQSLNKYEKLL